MVVLAGDFRQTLPIVPKGTTADELKACLKSSYIWSSVHKLKLTINMRAVILGDEAAEQFSEEPLSIGNGKLERYTEGHRAPLLSISAVP